MFDDTRDIQYAGQMTTPNPSGAGTLSENVAAILANPVTRSHASKWASSLRFLTFDDSDDDSSQVNSLAVSSTVEDISIHGQCQPCARRTPIPSGHMCCAHLGSNNKENFKIREMSYQQYDNPCIHVKEHSCSDCQHIPLFPNEGKITKFRIRRVYSLESEKTRSCGHYVAVSYCWSGESDNRSQGQPYQIIEEDGKERDARAPNALIDRIVNFARENGFRMIWIDQECIEQNQPKEKELAIQAMDYVYTNAKISIGLFNTHLQQKHLDSLVLAFESRGGQPFKEVRGRRALNGCRKVDLHVMYDALSMIVNDKWNTRAWILQEAFASSGNMILLFPRVENVDAARWLLICHELSQSELAIQLDAIQRCLEACHQLLGPLILQTLQGKPARCRRGRARGRGKEQRLLGQKEEIQATMRRLQFFHPRHLSHPWTFWVNNSKPRRTCNAATALSYLQTRDLLRVVDKTAIVANICGYDFRVNASKLEETQNSLATCIMALSIANGDFSLLVPQVYRVPEAETLEFPSPRDLEFTWAHSFTRKLQHLSSTNWDTFGPGSESPAATGIQLSKNGLSLLGLLWNMDRFLDLKPLQVKYADSWNRLRNVTGRSSPSHGTIELANTHILFEIIQYLVALDEKAVANSILNSTSSWSWSGRNDMIESVDQFPSGLRIENRKGMFLLDYGPDGWPYQCWIIDRVMNNGGFWVGRLVKQVLEKPTAGLNDAADIGAEMTLDQINNTATMVQGTETQDTSPALTIDGEVLHRRSHFQTMRSRYMAKLLFESVPAEKLEQSPLDEDTKTQQDIRLNSKNIAYFLLSTSMIHQSADYISHREAVFDIDGTPEGQNMVLTPLQLFLESIPRPAMRSMAISWIVEPVQSDLKGHSGDPSAANEDEVFTIRDMARGMWEFSVLASGRYTIA
ncbi:heterokaryon incompatibility protein-domain-containing protein [Xylaria sp. FL1777]|nr:heterokaryon incompatibility protein-domain-containing protein [Xylaria sp. FL1777]